MMNYYEQTIMEMANANQGLVTSLQVTQKNIPQLYLKRLVDKNLLEKVDRGIYICPTTFEDEIFNLQNRFTKGIFSHETALFLLDLTDRTPIRYTMTFPAGYNATTAKTKNIIACFSIKDRYEVGLTTLPTPNGFNVRAYNAERTLCDLLQKRSHTDIQLLIEAFKRYIQKSQKDIPLLSKYAQLFQVEKRLRPYLEVLI
ncbi:MAG: type IV toxin-antitoxin system AbiEi family antitoxin domain-containing protein [bacterium]|nr:type IV toxin-antitoxin system AbiEi family antitoxin domain-containing protein [bacterium]